MKFPGHWVDEKHEEEGTAHDFIDTEYEQLDDEISAIGGCVNFRGGVNVGAKVLTNVTSSIFPSDDSSFDEKSVSSLDHVSHVRPAIRAMSGVGTDQVSGHDDVTGAVLKPELVIEARRVEMECFSKMKVYDIVPREESTRTGKAKVIKGRWIDTNKGDSIKPDYRSRFVGKEFNTGVDAALYAATPPLEALKLLVSHAASNRSSKLHMRFSDVKRAYFNAVCTR